jgi:hypothetical protein
MDVSYHFISLFLNKFCNQSLMSQLYHHGTSYNAIFFEITVKSVEVKKNHTHVYLFRRIVD